MRRDLIVAWMAVAFDVLWQCHLTKNKNKTAFPLIYFLETTVICWHAPPLPPHSLVCFIHHLRPSHIDFGANWNCPFCFMLLYVFISKTKAYLSVVFVQLENVKARIVTSGQESDGFLCSALRVRWHPSLCSNVTEEQNSGVKI